MRHFWAQEKPGRQSDARSLARFPATGVQQRDNFSQGLRPRIWTLNQARAKSE